MASLNDLPIILLVAKLIQCHASRKLLRVLFDSGGSHIMISGKALSPGMNPMMLEHKRMTNTLAGTLHTNREVILSKMVLPKFDRSKCIDEINAFVFDKPCHYNTILGRDFLNKSGIVFNFKHGYMDWMEHCLSMKPLVQYQEQQLTLEEFLLLEDDKKNLEEEEEFDSFVSKIKDANMRR
eukprot:4045829-Ditylum_brightwellii.AAC.2